jgi:molybdate transport system ATP-binding protein
MTLSNGQTRRARLARALLAKPELLILDDPFIGLDAAGRTGLSDLLAGLVRDGRRVVLICREDVQPEWATNVLRFGKNNAELPEMATEPISRVTNETQMLSGKGIFFVEQASSLTRFSGQGTSEDACATTFRIASHTTNKLQAKGDAIVELSDVSVVHAGRAILDRVSWTVRSGERWAVVGPNGSGKTTLLSLLCGDHPQAYSNDVRLFGRRRGTGETIWDVKRNVGLVSPEFHLYFTEPLTAERTVATGFFDVLADRSTTSEQTARVHDLFAAFGAMHLLPRQFRCLSTGEQRLVLLLRALVKRPPLLILDEPFQGFDIELIERCRVWLDRELREDQTLLFVTHDLQELPKCVDRLLRLEAGCVR